MAPTVTGPIRQQIGPLKANLTKHQTAADNLLAAAIPTDATEKKDMSTKANLICKNINTATTRLQDKHDAWVELLKQAPDEQTHYESSAEELMELLCRSDELCNGLESLVTTLAPVSNPTNLPAQPAAQARPVNVFKTEKIKLPTFSGDYLEFKQFWGIFEENIHKRQDLTNIEKFTYLVAQLDGDAKKAISGVHIHNDNYEVAVDLLKNRFDRADDRLVTLLYSQFMRIPISKHKTQEKQNTLDECERIFRQLEASGEDINSNRSLVCGFLSKFPAAMVKDLQRYYNVGAKNTLDEVRKGIWRSIAEEEATTNVIGDLQAMKPQPKEGQKEGESAGQGRPPSSGHTMSSFDTKKRGASGQRGGSQMLSPPSDCYFCGGKHFLGECDVYPTAVSRKQRLIEVNRCPRCMKNHPRGKCPVGIKCVHCRTNEHHVSALCFKKYPEVPPAVMGGSTPQLTPSTPQPTPASSGTGGNQNPNPTSPDGSYAALIGPKTNGGMTVLNSDPKPALFQTAKTIAINPFTGQQCVVRLALDTLSSRSYIRDSLARQLGLVGEHSEKLYVSVFGSTKTVEVPTNRVEFDVLFRNGNRCRVEANTTKVICQSAVLNSSWTPQEQTALNHFASSLADDPYDRNGDIDVLIGAGLVWDFVEGPRFPTAAAGLFLIPTKFGLMLSGESQSTSKSSESTMLCITESPCQFPSALGMVAQDTKFEVSYPDIDEFWNLEAIGITDDPLENDDDKALEKFQETVKFENGRYQVTLPWIDEKKALLPSNYDMAYERFRGLSKRLKTNPEMLQGYRDVIQVQTERGIIEEVPMSEIDSSNITHYLPHHAVLKPTSSTTKTRIVYDAAAKKNRNSVSLNECLLRGPVLLPDLCMLLIRLRTHETIVTSDIEKAFLMVGLQPSERDVTRFLWFKDPSNLDLTDNVTAFRFTRVNFGVISSPFLLAATLDHHLTRENSEFAESLRDNVYVDNVVSSLDEEDPLEYYTNLKALFQRAGMNIQEFCSNSSEFFDLIPECDRVKQTDVRLFGLKWDSLADDSLRLTSPSKFVSSSSSLTKRKVLQAIASIYDPLGLFSPVILPTKWYLQKLWGNNHDWDELLPEVLEDEWLSLLSNVKSIFDHRIPRFVGKIVSEDTLAVFCDASAKAYCTAIYLRCPQPDGSWDSNLIFSKTRLSPQPSKRKTGNKSVTLPRLELLGAVIGAHGGEFCRKALKVPKLHIDFFIDSQCVLQWIRSRGLLKRFVANRIEKIRRVAYCEFHYVPTKDNPADYGTRGKYAHEILNDDLWWKGPSWLRKGQSDWPKSEVPPISDTILREVQSEIKPVFISHTLVAIQEEPEPIRFLNIDPENVSSITKLVRISVIWLKFLKTRVWNKLSDATRNSKPGLDALFGSISDEPTCSVNDCDAAMLQWIRMAQCAKFPNELQYLKLSDAAATRCPQMVQQLDLQLDENGLIRTCGRMHNAELSETARSPYLLPKAGRFTALIIEDVHERAMHSGVSHTLSLIRQRFWIPHARSLIRQVLRRCVACRRFKTARPFKLPPMPAWPSQRVSRSAPFSTTGLDYFGPVTVKVHEQKQKMWVCLFTCLSTRAIHLEPVMDFSAQEFLHCLMRFTARRGVPHTIISDNAAQFQLVKVLGDKAWKRMPSDDAVITYAVNNGIKWKFITELAPWQGGFYERLVGVVKSTLRTSIRNKLLTWTDFVTLLTEAEAIVNSRPLTYINDDVNSQFRIIRPCDFLSPTTTSVSDSKDGSEVSPKDFGEAGKRLVSIWKQRCRTLEKLWRIWQEDYLMSMRERPKVNHKSNRSDVDKSPFLGQVVLILDEDAPRSQWRLARVTKLFESSDGHVRSAEIRQSNGIILRRALNHLIPLEVEPPPTDEDTDSPGPDSIVAPLTNPILNENDDDGGFDHFTPEDIQRTIDALRSYEGVDLDESTA